MRHQFLSSKVGMPFFISISVVLLLCLSFVAHTAPAEMYLLFAKEKVEVGVDTRILSGDIGSNETSDDAIRFRQGASTSATSNIRGDKIRLGANVTVGSIFYNTLDASPSAAILGANVDNLDLPVVADFPSIPDFSTGNDDITVAKDTSLTLPAGSYDDIEVKTNGVLVLSGGDYFLNRFNLKGNAFVVAEQDARLFIASRFEVGRGTTVNYERSPKKLEIVYAGEKTVNLRSNNRVKALLLAPSAKVNVGFGAIFAGRILAKKIEAQARSVLTFNPFDGSVAPPSTPDPFTLFAKSRLKVGRGSRIDAGQIGSNGTSKVAMEFQRGASTTETVMLFSDQLKLDENVVVGHAFYNDVQQHPTATIRFPSSPINLPIVNFFPVVPPFQAGTNDLEIPSRAHTTVTPGRYRNIRIGKNATITFEPGQYFINRLVINRESDIRFSGQTALFVKQRIGIGRDSTFNTQHPPRDVRIQFSGSNSINFGKNSDIHVKILAPDATVNVGHETHFSGRIWSNKIDIARNVTMNIIDLAPPITTASPAGGIFPEPIDVTLAADESAIIYYTTDGADPSIRSPVFTNPIRVNDNLTLKFFAVDDVGNQEEFRTETYIIDAEPPVIDISGINNGDVTHQDVTPIITITDDNLDTTDLTLNGQPFQSGTTLQAEGDYQLEVVATDLVGNTATESAGFTIDKTLPIILNFTPTDGDVSINPRPTIRADLSDDASGIDTSAVTLVLDGTDVTSESTVTETAVSFAPATDITVGAHIAQLRVTDRAGNAATAQTTFTVQSAAPPLTVVATATPIRGNVPLAVSFSATTTGNVVKYEWDFEGDSISDFVNAASATTTFTYSTVGVYSATLRVTDTSGATASDSVRIEVLPKQPARIVTTSPANGEGNVAVTRETIIRLSKALATSTTVDASNLFAEFGGAQIPGRIHTSPDRKTLTMFYDDFLPASARVRVTFIGDNMFDVNGDAVDADGDGNPGGTATIDFDTLSLTVLPGTSVSGRVFASELGDGGTNVPLSGVTITVDGEDKLRTVTDALGNFRLDPAPAGRFFVHIDGTTATNDIPEKAYYPSVGKSWDSVPGEETGIGNIFLPLIVANTLQPVSVLEETAITFPDAVLAEHPELQGTSVMVPADSLFSDDGTRGGMVGIAPVAPDRLPGELPDGLDFSIVITVQTDGATNFDQPAPICFPNLDNLLPGAKSALWSFNHDTGRFEIVGPMTASDDGTKVCNDPGVGILAPGWHGVQQGTQGHGGATLTQPPRPRTRPIATGPQEPSIDDCDSGATCKSPYSVLLHSGEERWDAVDLTIPGRGINFVMSRRYRSQLDYDGPLGFGWTYLYNEGLYFEPNGDVVRFHGGSHLDRWTLQPDGSFRPPPGHFRTLVQQGDGGYVLRSPSGFRRFYRSDGRLSAYEDRYGNRMLFEYDAPGNLDRVIDTYGREIDIVFESFPDGVDRLTRVVDFIGREVVYRYDNRGDLVEVRSPVVMGTSTGNDFPEGRTERYTYTSGFTAPELNHNLLTMTYPQEVAEGGEPAHAFTYGTDPGDPVTFDRVLTETIGGTNASGVMAGGTMVYNYERLNEQVPPGDTDLPRGKATITERNGNQWEYFVNERHQHIITRRLTREVRPDEPAFYETQRFFDADNLLQRVVLPEGNEVRYAYDTAGTRGQQQNVVEVRRVADAARGGGQDLVTTYTYEPLFNQISSMTSPRGNAVEFAPPLGTASPMRYTTRWLYDYQEGTAPVELAEAFGTDLSSVPRGLGDLNGDGRLDQVAGNLVRTQAPAVLLRANANEAARLGSTTQQILTEIQWNDRGQVLATIDPEGNVMTSGYYPEDDPDGDGMTTRSAYRVLTAESTGYLQQSIVDAAPSPRRTATVGPAALETRYGYDRVGNLISVRNPRGVVTDIEVNQLNEAVVVTRGADVSEALSSGQLLQEEEPFGYRTRLTYDFNGRVVRTEIENRDSTTEGVGDFVEYTTTYDILHDTVQSTVEIDTTTLLTTQYRYDKNQLLTLVIQPESNQTVMTYDERNLLFTMTRGFGSPEASTVQVDYDLNANRQRLIDAQDNDGDGLPEITTIIYDGFDRPVEIVDALGNQTRTDYDVASNAVRRQAFGHPADQPRAPDVLLAETFYQHDELNRVFQVDQSLFLADGFVTARSVDLQDGNSDGSVTSLVEFDALSRITSVVEDDGEVTQTVYDGVSRVIEATDALGNRQSVTYDHNSNVVRTTSLERSSEGLVPEESFETFYIYDQLDRLIRATDNLGQTARFAYDSRDNPTFRSDPQGPVVADPLGLFPVDINDPGNTCTWVYDGLDRMIRQACDLRTGGQGGNPLDTTNPTNPDGRIDLTYVYDGNSRLAAIIDDNRNQTSFGYDALDRKTNQTNADGGRYLTIYDRDHNVIEVTDPNGSVIRNTHDVLNRLTRQDVTRASGVAGTTLETYAYDGLSRPTRCTDDNGGTDTTQVVAYAYDSLSRPLEERQNGQVISTVFSGDSKRLRRTYPGGRTLSLAYDAIDRVKTVTDPNGLISQFDYIGPGLRKLRRVHGNNTQLSLLNDAQDAEIGYDGIKRLVHLRHLLPDRTTAFVDREYGYNRANMRLSDRRHDDADLEDRYAYDSVYRVIQSLYDQNGQTAAAKRDQFQQDYVFDGVGNRRNVQTTSNTSGVNSEPYTVNKVNEYVTKGTANRVHDDKGNLLDNDRLLFAYDYRNRLVSAADKATGNLVALYFYDCQNRRTRKRIFSQTTAGKTEQETLYFYNGWEVYEEQDTAGQTRITYVYGNGIDEIVQFERMASHGLGPGAFYTHQDIRGDVIAVTDNTGDLIEKRFYDDYGRPLNESKQPSGVSDAGNPYGFQGRRHDPETGLIYFRNRYYDPETGRFIQRDPVWDAGNVGNQYAFVGNGPMSRRDPNGTFWVELLQGGVDVLRGAGDVLSLGLTRKAREAWHGDRGKVIYPGAYKGGQVGGVALAVGIGGGAGLQVGSKLALGRAALPAFTIKAGSTYIGANVGAGYAAMGLQLSQGDVQGAERTYHATMSLLAGPGTSPINLRCQNNRALLGSRLTPRVAISTNPFRPYSTALTRKIAECMKRPNPYTREGKLSDSGQCNQRASAMINSLNNRPFGDGISFMPAITLTRLGQIRAKFPNHIRGTENMQITVEPVDSIGKAFFHGQGFNFHAGVIGRYGRVVEPKTGTIYPNPSAWLQAQGYGHLNLQVKVESHPLYDYSPPSSRGSQAQNNAGN